MDGQGLLLTQVMDAGDIENVILLKGDIHHRATQQAFDIYWKNLGRQVLVFTIQDGTAQECITAHTFCLLDKLLDRIDGTIQLIESGAIYGTLHLYPILITAQDGIHSHFIAIVHPEHREVDVIHIIHLVFTTTLSDNRHGFLIGIARKAAGIFQQGAHRLVALQLIEHRALHLTGDANEGLIGIHQDDVTVLQTDIILQLALHQQVIDIQYGKHLLATHHLDGAKATDVVHAASTIECMKDRGK